MHAQFVAHGGPAVVKTSTKILAQLDLAGLTWALSKQPPLVPSEQTTMSRLHDNI
jgi:hypothetical protein